MWEMTRDNGTFLYERATDHMTGKTKILSVKIKPSASGKITGASRREAQERLRAKVAETQPKRLHFSDLIELYEAEHIRSVRESTFHRDHCSLMTMLTVLDDVYVDQLTAGYIRRKLIESGKENSTMNELIKRTKTFLMWAYRNDYCPREIADKLTLFPDKSARAKIADKFLEKDELQALLGAMENERWRLLTEFLALSGLRIGEALALDNEDVGPEYISVTKTYNEALSSLGDTKTESSNRTVYIQPELAEVIKKIRVCMAKQRMMYGYKDKGYFFTGITGRRVGYAGYNKYLQEIAKQVVPNKHVVPHTLRHTMTSLFSEAGIDISIIATRLGHVNSNITKRIYLHITKTRQIQDNHEVSSVFLLA